MNTRVGKGFLEKKMANLKVFIAKVCEATVGDYCFL